MAGWGRGGVQATTSLLVGLGAEGWAGGGAGGRALFLPYFCFCQLEVLGPHYLGLDPNIWTYPVEMQRPRNPTARPRVPQSSLTQTPRPPSWSAASSPALPPALRGFRSLLPKVPTQAPPTVPLGPGRIHRTLGIRDERCLRGPPHSHVSHLPHHRTLSLRGPLAPPQLWPPSPPASCPSLLLLENLHSISHV